MQEQEPRLPLLPQEAPVGRGKLLFMLMGVTVVLLLFILFSGKSQKSGEPTAPSATGNDVATVCAPLESRIRELEARIACYENPAEPQAAQPQAMAKSVQTPAQPPSINSNKSPKEEEDLFFVALQEELQSLGSAQKAPIAVPPPAAGSLATQPSTSPASAPKANGKAAPKTNGSNAGAKTAPSSPPTSRVQTHIVKRGETLSQISLEYYGSAQRWKLIYEANRAQIPNINQLKVGTELIIPELPAK